MASLNLKTLLSALLMAAILYGATVILNQKQPVPTSYWLWAGLTARDAPTDANLYVYQGVFKTQPDGSPYRRIGLYPHPIKSSSTYLTYRIEGPFPDASLVIQTFLLANSKWRKHQVRITGLQLDFDSPTSKLLIYSDYLKQVRSKLPKDFKLSITGLGDWSIYGHRETLLSISRTVDEIVFQLYQDRSPLPGIKTYIEALAEYPFPFRIGLLVRQENEHYIRRLQNNPNFNGVIYFIQRNI